MSIISSVRYRVLASEIQRITKLDMVQLTVKTTLDSAMLETRGDSNMKRSGCSLSRVQIKDSGLTEGVDAETSPFITVRVSFRMHSKK